MKRRKKGDGGQLRLPRPGEEKVIRDFLPLVKHVAATFIGPGVLYDDLVQAGRIGVLRAIRTYDPSRGATFPTWASRRIRWAMLDAVADQSTSGVRLVSLDQDQKRDISVGDGDGELLRLHEIIAAPDGSRGSRWTIADYTVLRLLVEKLPKQERGVVRAHYWGDLTLTEIARARGVTRQRVSVIHRNAIQMLRKSYGVEVNSDGRT